MYDLSIFYWGVYVLVYYTVITKNFTWFTEMLQKWIFYLYGLQFSSVQSLSHVRLFATPWSCTPCATHQASLSITNSWSLLKLMFIESVMPSNHLILCCPLLLPPSIFPTIRVFSNESVLHIRWPKYWSFSCSISPFNEYSGLISFRVDWLDLLAVQGTLKSLLQHHSSKASILQHSDFFIAQLSHPYMTTGKTIALTRWIFVGKVRSLLFNMLYMDLLHLKIIFILPFNKYFIAPTRCQEVSHQNSKPILKVNIQKYVVIGFTFKRFPPYTSRYQLKTTNIGA